MQPDFICQFCGKSVDPNSPNTYLHAMAWFPRRKAGSPAMVGPPQGFAHFGCIEIEKHNPIRRNSDSFF